MLRDRRLDHRRTVLARPAACAWCRAVGASDSSRAGSPRATRPPARGRRGASGRRSRCRAAGGQWRTAVASSDLTELGRVGDVQPHAESTVAAVMPPCQLPGVTRDGLPSESLRPAGATRASRHDQTTRSIGCARVRRRGGDAAVDPRRGAGSVSGRAGRRRGCHRRSGPATCPAPRSGRRPPCSHMPQPRSRRGHRAVRLRRRHERARGRLRGASPGCCRPGPASSRGRRGAVRPQRPRRRPEISRSWSSSCRRRPPRWAARRSGAVLGSARWRRVAVAVARPGRPGVVDRTADGGRSSWSADLVDDRPRDCTRWRRRTYVRPPQLDQRPWLSGPRAVRPRRRGSRRARARGKIRIGAAPLVEAPSDHR